MNISKYKKNMKEISSYTVNAIRGIRHVIY